LALSGLWWWIDRWRKSTAYTDMTLAEQGAYRNLLDEAHLRGGALPNNERILAKASGDAVGWPEVRAVVMAHFELHADGWHNATLDSVLRESNRRAEKQREYRARQDSGNATGNATGNAGGNKGRPPDPSPDPDPDLSRRARTFCERYAQLYRDHRRGARYVSKPDTDLVEAEQLVRVWDDDRLEQLAVAFLKTDHDFAEKGSRTMAQFRSMASWCDSRLREAGL